MANRRMFSLDIIDTDKFVEMPASTQALYFHLGMRADDDGFVASPKKIAGMTNCSIDDLRLLITKQYLIPFEDGVVVITDWKTNNYIRADRKHDTRFAKQLSQLEVINDTYQLSTKCQPIDRQLVDNCHTEVRLGKDRVRDKDNINIICPELEAPDRQSVINLPLNDKTEHLIYQDDVDKWLELYPNVDVMQELRKMKGWLDANPTKRKTKRGINRFINGWLSKEQDKGGSRQQSAPVQKPNSFNNFTPRKYDMNDMEKKLLGLD